MKLESLERLREWSCRPEIRDIADAIQAEVDECYMPLPLDAYGIPIRVGDKIVGERGQVVTVNSVNEDWFYPFIREGYNPRKFHHVEPRTVEDVLREVVAAYMDTPLDDSNEGEFFEKYAAKLREAMGGDAE